MSTMDTAQLLETISTPADSCKIDEKAFRFGNGTSKWRYTYRWGTVTNPNRITIIIMTVNDPLPDVNGSRTVYYDPADCLIMVGGNEIPPATADHALHSFNYDVEKPELVRDLAMAQRWLSTHVRPAFRVPGA